jgi:NADH pyrophosphatase NudC (nudix superfamily)
MIAFRAEVHDTPPQPTDGEIVASRWFTAAELRDRAEHDGLGPPDSLNQWLLTSWLAEKDHP